MVVISGKVLSHLSKGIKHHLSWLYTPLHIQRERERERAYDLISLLSSLRKERKVIECMMWPFKSELVHLNCPFRYKRSTKNKEYIDSKHLLEDSYMI
jgi:hypothetical protein